MARLETENLFADDPVLAQPPAPSKSADETEITVRPERNLEKWPIWEATNSRHQMQERMLQREIRLPDGSVALARVRVGYTNNGALTTEDQKTCYALFRLWEEQEKPEGQVFFTRQQLARVLKKSWGSKTNKAITDSLMRLRFTPFVWERSYYDSATQETVERIDTFNILSELHLVRRSDGDRTVSEGSWFTFNSRILTNLLAGFTRPVYLDTILKFQSEIAQILYTHLDLVMADKTHYERRTKELFADLGIDGATYRYPSKRAEMLERALPELEGVPVPTGTLSVSLERTVDKTDYKLVATKTRKGITRSHIAEEILPSPIPELPPPIVTRVVNAPPKKKRGSGSSGSGVRGPESGKENGESGGGGRRSSYDTPSARALVAYFHEVFFQATPSGQVKARPTARELALAADHLERLGEEKARFLIRFAHREARKTGFSIQNYGGVAQYEVRAMAEETGVRGPGSGVRRKKAEGHGEHEEEATSQHSTPSTQHSLRTPDLGPRTPATNRAAYLDYLRDCLADMDRSPTVEFEAFLVAEQMGRERLTVGKDSESPTVRRLLASYDTPNTRLNRFRDFLRERLENGDRVPGVLSFKEWEERE